MQRGVQAQIDEPLTGKGGSGRKRSGQGDQDKSARKKSTGLGSRETASQIFVFPVLGLALLKRFTKTLNFKTVLPRCIVLRGTGFACRSVPGAHSAVPLALFAVLFRSVPFRSGHARSTVPLGAFPLRSGQQVQSFIIAPIAVPLAGFSVLSGA